MSYLKYVVVYLWNKKISNLKYFYINCIVFKKMEVVLLNKIYNYNILIFYDIENMKMWVVLFNIFVVRNK